MTDIETADRLYRELPDFAAWQGLGATDVELWRLFAENLAAKRAAARPEDFAATVEVAMRAAAIDTGAIEGLYTVDRGFTLTVALQGIAWQHMLDERGADVRRLFEAQLDAYELVLDAATARLPITEAWIRALHERICAAQATYRVLTPQGWQDHSLAAGRYKVAPNHVQLADGGLHAYAPVDRVPIEMGRLVAALASPDFAAAHPLLQASYAHYALVNIHPFADGNGRVARALASVFFYRAVSIPLVVFADQRRAYFDALEEADRGNPAAIVAFFRERGLDTMQLAADSLAKSAHQPGEVGEDRSAVYGEQEAIACRLLAAVEEGLRARLAALRLPPGVAADLRRRSGDGGPADDGWQENGMHLVLELAPPASPARLASIGLQVLTAADAAAALPFRLAATGDDGDPMDVRRGDVDPELSTFFRLRLDQWIDHQLNRALGELRSGRDGQRAR